MSDSINWCDLKKNAKHIGEVSTSRTDGSPTGAEIDTSTNEVTGQVRDTLAGKFKKMDAQIDVALNNFSNSLTFNRVGSFADHVGDQLTTATRMNSYSTGTGATLEWWALIDDAVLPTTVPAGPGSNWALISAVTVNMMRTDSASQLSLVYFADYEVGMTIPDDAMRDKLAIWHNGQFYRVGTDAGFTSNDFAVDLLADRFVSAELATKTDLAKKTNVGAIAYVDAFIENKSLSAALTLAIDSLSIFGGIVDATNLDMNTEYLITGTITVNKPVVFNFPSVGYGDDTARDTFSVKKTGDFNAFVFTVNSAFSELNRVRVHGQYNPTHTADGVIVDSSRWTCDRLNLDGHGGSGLKIIRNNAGIVNRFGGAKNNKHGLEISGSASAGDANGMSIFGLDVKANNGYGLSIVNSFGNMIYGLTTQYNKLGGQYIDGDNNKIFGCYSEGNKDTTSGVGYGVVFGANADNNTVEFAISVGEELFKNNKPLGNNTAYIKGTGVGNMRLPTCIIDHASIDAIDISRYNSSTSTFVHGGSSEFTGSGTVAFGRSALAALTSGANNAGFGYLAMVALTSGNNNVAIGMQALKSLTTGSECTAVGKNSGGTLVDGSVVGSLSNITTLGSDSKASGANQLQLGKAGITSYAYGAVQDRSDARDKIDIKNISDAHIAFFMDVGWRTYRMNFRDNYDDFNASRSTEKAGKREHIGAIAQQVEEAMIKHGIDFAGLQYHKINGGNDIYTIGYQEFIGIQGEILQRQQRDIDAIKAKLGL